MVLSSGLAGDASLYFRKISLHFPKYRERQVRWRLHPPPRSPVLTASSFPNIDFFEPLARFRMQATGYGACAISRFAAGVDRSNKTSGMPSQHGKSPVFPEPC